MLSDRLCWWSVARRSLVGFGWLIVDGSSWLLIVDCLSLIDFVADWLLMKNCGMAHRFTIVTVDCRIEALESYSVDLMRLLFGWCYKQKSVSINSARSYTSLLNTSLFITSPAPLIGENIIDAPYDRGSTFPLNCFPNDGVPQPKIVRMPIFFRKTTLLYTRAMGSFIGMQCHFRSSQFSGEVWSSLSSSEEPQTI